MSYSSKLYKISIFSLFSGITVILCSIGIYFLSNWIINKNIKENEIIRLNSSGFNYWMNPPANILRSYYFFDISNQEEFSQGRAKPQLIQRGPYVYREQWEKKKVQFLSDELVSYYQVSSIYFDQEKSNGTEDDMINFLNVPAISALESARYESEKNQGIMNEIIKLTNSKLFFRHTVKELLSGFKDPLLEIAKIFKPNLVKSSIFSMLNGKNGTLYQNFTMMTGISNISDVGRLVSWNNNEKLDYWYSPYANLINGSDSTTFPPYRKRDQRVYAYNSDMCRSYYLEYFKDDVHNGIKTYNFHLPKTIFYNTTYNPDSNGFCENECVGNGVLNISTCYGGNTFISMPHFLNAEEKFLQAVDGLSPDESRHDFLMKFEPTTGVSITGNIRLQICFSIFNSPNFDILKKVPNLIYPVIWFDESYELFPDISKQLKQVSFYVQLAYTAEIVLLAIGSVSILTSSLLIIVLRCKKSKTNSESIVTSSESTPLLNGIN
jgi:hypothetical protein